VERTEFCKTCSVGKLRNKYRKKAKAVLDLKLGEGHGFEFDDLERRVAMIGRISGGPDEPVPLNTPASVLSLIAAYRGERHRQFKKGLEGPVTGADE
jgi:hypothetical protein